MHSCIAISLGVQRAGIQLKVRTHMHKGEYMYVHTYVRMSVDKCVGVWQSVRARFQ